jgi:glucosamine-6-phosphate deaminase
METTICNNKEELGKRAAERGIALIKEAITKKGSANIILATGASQFATMEYLVKSDIDWSHVTMFHLDEYINLPETHPASFRKYLKERFINKVTNLKAAYLIDGNGNSEKIMGELEKKILDHPIDVCFAGIGENCHLAFNDPPADFETENPYIVVKLDEDCRKQQLGEGWFSSLEEVPEKAISMSIKQIMKSKTIILSVPDERKAAAVFSLVNRPVSPEYPATIIRNHGDSYLYIDSGAASLLQE